MKRWKVRIAVALSLVTLVIVMQNTSPIETIILFWSVETPQALLIAITLLIGCVVGLLLSHRMLKAPPARKPD